MSKCKKHPSYRGVRKPKTDCAACKQIWEKTQLAATYAFAGCYDDPDVEALLEDKE